MMRKTILLVLPFLLGALILIIVAAALSSQAPAPALMPPEATDEARVLLLAADPGLQAGEAEYNLRCGHCHGFNGEGEIGLPSSAEITLDLGMKLVPPHNADGTTYLHPEQLLVRLIQGGSNNPLFRFVMPPFAGVITEEQTRQILAYIRLWWTDDQRAHNAEVTAARATLEAQFASP